MTYSICIHCGGEKKRPVSKCSNCGFEPVSDEDKAKALIFSLDYEIDGEYRGKTKEELKAISVELRSGSSYEFDPLEVQAVVDYAHKIVIIPSSKLIVDGLRWLLPPVALLVVALFFLTR
jgi:hypothetical protein